MRKLLIIGSVLLVIIGLVVFALTNVNSLIASNKDQILQQVEQTLGREVEVQVTRLTGAARIVARDDKVHRGLDLGRDRVDGIGRERITDSKCTTERHTTLRWGRRATTGARLIHVEQQSRRRHRHHECASEREWWKAEQQVFHLYLPL